MVGLARHAPICCQTELASAWVIGVAGCVAADMIDIAVFMA